MPSKPKAGNKRVVNYGNQKPQKPAGQQKIPWQRVPRKPFGKKTPGY
jgi:hypothetical protein